MKSIPIISAMCKARKSFQCGGLATLESRGDAVPAENVADRLN